MPADRRVHMKKLLMIFNPRAGKNRSREKQDNLLRVFKQYGFAVTEKTTTCVGDATEIIKHNLNNHDLIVCCGGDGTFNEAINGIMSMKSKVPLMYVPMGSTNDLANTIGVTKDVESQIDLFLNGYINDYDIGRFNDNYFSYVASFGVASDLSYTTSQKMKNVLGHAAYVLDGFIFRFPQQVKNMKPYHMRIEYDGNVIEDDFYFGAVSNTNEVGGIFKFDNCNVKLNDGKFEVLLVRKLRGVPDAFYLLKKIRAQDYDGDRIVNFKASSLKIECSRDTAWTLDGEFGGNHRNVEISIENSAVNIVSPPSKYFITDKKIVRKPEPVFDDEDIADK